MEVLLSQMLCGTLHSGCMFDVGLMSCGETSRKPIPQQQPVSVANMAGSFLVISLLLPIVCISALHHLGCIKLSEIQLSRGIAMTAAGHSIASGRAGKPLS